MKNLNVKHFSILAIPLMFVIPVIFALLEKPISLFPWDKKVYFADAYADGDERSDGKGSTIDSFKTEPHAISVSYTLRDAEEYPYAGIFFSLISNNANADLSAFDYMKLKVSADMPDVYQIKIATWIEGYTKERDSNTYCPLEKTLYVRNSMNEYNVPLSQFGLLDWWFEDAGLKPSDYKPRTLLKKVYQINLQMTKQMAKGSEEKHTIIIRSISIHKSNIVLYAISGLGFVIASVIAIFVIAMLQKKSRAKNGLPKGEWSPITLDNYTDLDTKRLSDFIEENYTNPDLTVMMLYKETGIARRRITLLTRKKYGMDFKRVINGIRLTEAERLLKETDRNITDIAMALGFGGPSYFFQVFRRAHRMSPSEYRKKHSH
jgi:AraC-like DNA-binding protein